MIRLIVLAATIAALATTAATANASIGLVGQWQLNEGAGTVVGDSSGYGDSGTCSVERPGSTGETAAHWRLMELQDW